MKAPSPKLLLEECAALSVPFLGALAELTIRNGYHQISAEPTRFVYLACLIAFSLGAALATEFGRLDGAARQSVRSANRVLGLAAWAWIVGIRGVALTDWLDGAPATTRVVTIAGMAALVWLAFDELRWRRARPALLLAASLFVLSQPVLGRMSSPELAWPDIRGGTPGTASDAVIIVLLDELNAQDGPRLAQVLRDHGMAVAERAIDPVADATAKVIPEIWSGRRFTSPKPCSFTAICSEGRALDFAKVTASRPDIDVVGFYHPYCAMRGLRWCERPGLSLPFDEAGRWACSIKSRLGLADVERCIALQNEPFIQLRSEVLLAMWRAPFWRQGGVLFAHLPLPHPPGAHPGGTLKQDYRDNLLLASDVLGQMVDRVLAAGLTRVRLVVFSDHPLRQPLWCGKQAYQVRGCRPEPDLEDRRVPLIVATFGEDLPDLGAIDSNARVFDLVGGVAR